MRPSFAATKDSFDVANLFAVAKGILTKANLRPILCSLGICSEKASFALANLLAMASELL